MTRHGAVGRAVVVTVAATGAGAAGGPAVIAVEVEIVAEAATAEEVGSAGRDSKL